MYSSFALVSSFVVSAPKAFGPVSWHACDIRALELRVKLVAVSGAPNLALLLLLLLLLLLPSPLFGLPCSASVSVPLSVALLSYYDDDKRWDNRCR